MKRQIQRRQKGSRRLSIYLMAFVVSVVLASDVYGQWPSPRVNGIFPGGGKIGTSFDVTVVGTELDDLTTLEFNHEGIQATQKQSEATEFEPARPLPTSFQVTIDESVPPGIYEARVVGRWGRSNPRRFAVGTLEEVNETNNNRSPETAFDVAVNSVVNGRSDANNVEYYRIAVEAGRQIIVECQAEPIDSRGHFALEMLTASGAEISRHRDPRGGDPFLVYHAEEDTTVIVGLRDFLYRGGNDYYYRLRVHDGPYISSVWPPVISATESTTLNVYGWNLPNGKPVATMDRSNGLEVAEIEYTIDRETWTPSIAYSQPASYRVAPYDLQLVASHGEPGNAVPTYVTDLPIVHEQEPTSELADPDQVPQIVEIPAEVVGRFDRLQDVDRVRFDASQGQVIWIDVLSEQLGSSTDPQILVQRVVTDDQGVETLNLIAAVDDPPTRNNSIGSDFDLTTDDPSYRLQIPEDGTYQIVLRDLFSGRLDERDFYRLRLSEENPDFSVVAKPVVGRPANNNQVIVSSFTFRKGGSLKLDIVIDRIHGYDGTVTITPEGLPEGITCEPLILPGQVTTGALVFSASDSISFADTELSLVATGTVSDSEQLIERPVHIGSVVWGTGNRNQLRPVFRIGSDLPVGALDIESFPVTVRDGIPSEDPIRRETDIGRVYETSKGGRIEFKLAVERRNEFANAIQMSQVGLPNEFGLQNFNIEANATEQVFAIQATNNNLRPGWYVFYLRGDAQFKYQRNPEAITAATNEQQRLQTLIEQFTGQVNEANAALQTAQQAATQAQQQLQQAQTVENQAKTQRDQAQNELNTSQQQATQLQAQVEQNPEDEGLKQRFATAQTEAEAAQQRFNERQTTLEATTAEREAKEQQLAESNTAKDMAQQNVNDLQAKLQTAQRLKQQADQNLQNVNNVNREIDLTESMYAGPFYVHLVASPIVLQAENGAVAPSAELAYPVSINRDYGFDGNVDVVAEFPSEMSGATMTKLTLNGEQQSGAIAIRTAENTPAGTYSVVIKATGRFNNINVETTQTVQFVVQPEG